MKSLVPIQILSGTEMNPKTLTLNAGTGGTVTGAATFDYNATATLGGHPVQWICLCRMGGGICPRVMPIPLW